MNDYIYARAFSRNLGLINQEEQEVLRQSCVAIPGMGGVGGIELVTLARAGISRFHIADHDSFEEVNFNRQYGATLPARGRNKAEVMAEAVRSINPDAEILLFKQAIDAANADVFLKDADIVVDALDFFALETRRMLFAKAREKNLYVVSVGPIGFSGAMLIFSPTGMSFDEYFNLKPGMSFEEKMLAFAVGLSPGGTHLAYMDCKQVDLNARAGPSLGLACQIVGGMCAAGVIKILLKRGPVKVVPHYSQFDPYTMQYKQSYLYGGNRNPIQRLKIWYVKHILEKGKREREL